MVLIGTCGTGGIGIDAYMKGPLPFLEIDETFHARSSVTFARQLRKRGLEIRESAPKLHICSKLSRDLRGLNPLLLNARMKYCVRPLLETLEQNYVGLLVQLAPNFAASDAKMRQLAILARRFQTLVKDARGNPRLFVEFRHASWASAWESARACKRFCRELGISIVHVMWQGAWNGLGAAPQGPEDMRPTKTKMGMLWPPQLMSSGAPYIRLHGAASRYAGWYPPRALMHKLCTELGPTWLRSRTVLAFNNSLWGRLEKPSAGVRCVYKRARDGCNICNALVTHDCCEDLECEGA